MMKTLGIPAMTAAAALVVLAMVRADLSKAHDVAEATVPMTDRIEEVDPLAQVEELLAGPAPTSLTRDMFSDDRARPTIVMHHAQTEGELGLARWQAILDEAQAAMAMPQSAGRMPESTSTETNSGSTLGWDPRSRISRRLQLEESIYTDTRFGEANHQRDRGQRRRVRHSRTR